MVVLSALGYAVRDRPLLLLTKTIRTMTVREATRAISEKLQSAYAGRVNTNGVISAYGPVVYAQYDADAPIPIRVCIQEGPSISDRFTINLAEVPDRIYLLADLFKAIVPIRKVCAVRVLSVNF